MYECTVLPWYYYHSTTIGSQKTSNGACRLVHAQLTQRQQEILDYIRHVMTTEGISPTVQEIQREFQFRSPNAVQSHLRALSKKGVLARRGRAARTLRILGEEGWNGGGPPSQESASKPTAPVVIVPQADQVEMGMDVFFNAKHGVEDEFGGEVHGHSWRLRAVVLAGGGDAAGPMCLGPVRETLEHIASEIEGVVLNQLEPFRDLEPTLEHVATWLGTKIRLGLESLQVRLLSVTLWDQPTQYVTTSENGNNRSV